MPSDFRLMDAHLLPTAQEGYKWEFSDFRLVPDSPDTFGWDVSDIVEGIAKTYAIEVVWRSVSWPSYLLGDREIVLRFVDPLSRRWSTELLRLCDVVRECAQRLNLHH